MKRTNTAPRIIDTSGRLILENQAPRMQMLGSPYNPPYDAAALLDDDTAGWYPALTSTDWEINPYRDRIVSRVRDLVRNNGWASGIVTRELDNVVGSTFRPIAKPDYRWLAAYTGNKSFDAKWAKEFSSAAETSYRGWADDPMFYCDAARGQVMTQIFATAFRHYLIDGDALAQNVWLAKRVGFGRARYATAVNLIDPDRLSNPMQAADTLQIRGGCQLDENQLATVGYHIRAAHQGDWYSAEKTLTWNYFEREDEYGRPLIVHFFDRERAGQHRGAGGIFAPILGRFRMLDRLDRAELQAAVINSIFGAYIESPFDPQLVEEAVGDSVDVGWYQDARVQYHKEHRTMLGNARIPTLFPGEKINTVSETRAGAGFAEFQNAFLRNFASATGLSPQQVSQDWSDVNYSSARGALLEAWKTLVRRRDNFGTGFASPIRMAWMEEWFEVDRKMIPMPSGVKIDFIEARAAFSRCRWSGPGRGWLDPVAEREGAVIGMTGGMSTLEREVSEATGEDWEDVLDQRQIEVEGFKQRGLPVPEWIGPQPKHNSPNQDAGSHDPKSPNYRSRG